MFPRIVNPPKYFAIRVNNPRISGLIHIDPDSTSLNALPIISSPSVNTKVVGCAARVGSNNPHRAVPTYTYIFCRAALLNPRFTRLCVTRFSQKKQYSKQDTSYSSYPTSFSYGQFVFAADAI